MRFTIGDIVLLLDSLDKGHTGVVIGEQHENYGQDWVPIRLDSGDEDCYNIEILQLIGPMVYKVKDWIE